MKILNHNWAALDVAGGIKYAIGVTVVIVLSLFIDFSWMAVGMSALLTWLVNVPGPRRERFTNMILYIVIGAVLIGLAWALAGTYWPWMISMVVVAFLGTFAMIRGPRGFMLGWCLICLFYVAPLLGTAEMPLQVISAHILGGIAILIVLAQPFGNDPVAQDGSGEEEEKPSVSYVASYSAAVAIVMTIGLVMGDKWLGSDPTLILQASLMIMMPSVLGTWTVAVDRMIGLVLGVVAGFYLGQVAGGQIMEIVVWIGASFLLVTLMNVNAAPMIFFFVLPYSLVWGMLDAEAGHAIANERLWAELIGVILAGIAVSMRSGLANKFNVQRQ